MPDDRRKAAAKGGAASRAYNGGEARGRDIGKEARLCTVGDIRGKTRAGAEGRQEGTTSEKVRRVGVV